MKNLDLKTEPKLVVEIKKGNEKPANVTFRDWNVITFIIIKSRNYKVA